MWQRFFSQVLQDSFDKAKETDKSVSLRAYARRLRMSPSMLSELLRNQRKISSQRALEIAEKAQIQESVIVQLKSAMESTAPEGSRRLLNTEAIDLIMNPLYYRILCALELLPVPAKRSQLMEFLQITKAQLDPIADQLEILDIIQCKGEDVYWRGQHVATTEDVPSVKIQEYHKAVLRDAAGDLHIPVAEREYTSVTFVASEEKMTEAKHHIRTFRDTLSDSMREGKPDRIYQLSIQLRPVSPALRRET